MNALMNDVLVHFSPAHDPVCMVPFRLLPEDDPQYVPYVQPSEEYVDRVWCRSEWRFMMFRAALDIVNANQPNTIYKPWLRLS